MDQQLDKRLRDMEEALRHATAAVNERVEVIEACVTTFIAMHPPQEVENFLRELDRLTTKDPEDFGLRERIRHFGERVKKKGGA